MTIISQGFIGSNKIITQGFSISSASLPPSYSTKSTGTLLTEIIAAMEQESAGCIWKSGMWTPGMWDDCELLSRILQEIENNG